MAGKAHHTSQYIIQKVAPIFNKHGYYGTSMADLVEATGLTKGAIYGNFKNKDELAFLAFKFNVERVVLKIRDELTGIRSPLQQLYGITNFYRTYKSVTIEFGGCPILNIGVDANNQHPELLERVQDVITRLQRYITRIIQNGIDSGEIRKEINPKTYARKFFTLIEGAVFMTATMNDDSYIQEMMAHIDTIISKELAV